MDTPTAVKQIYAAENGLLWLLSTDGLLVYDGYQYHSLLLPDPHQESINENISQLISDGADGFWLIINNGGLAHYTPASHSLTRYTYSDTITNGLSSNQIHSLYRGTDGRLWIGLFREGVNIFSPHSQEFDLITFHDPRFTAGENARLNQVNMIIPSHVDTHLLWLASGRGLIELNKEDLSYSLHYAFNNPSLQVEESMNCIVEDKAGSLWIGSWGAGLYHFHPETLTWKRYLFDDVPVLKGSHNVILSISEKSDDELWIATTNHGIGTFNKNTQTFLFPENNPYNENAASYHAALQVEKDRYGNQWVLYNHRVLGMISAHPPAITYQPFEAYISQKNRYFMITDVAHIRQKTLLSAFFGEGVFQPSASGWTPLPVEQESEQGELKLRQFLQSDGEWYLFGNGKFYALDTTQLTLKALPDSLEDGFYRRPYSDGQRYMYFGSRWKGLFRYDLKTHQCINIDISKEHQAFYIGDLDQDSHGNIWAAHDNGITLLDTHTLHTQHINLKDSIYQQLRFQAISEIVRWKDQYLLLASHKGGIARVHEDSLVHKALHNMSDILDEDDQKVLSIERDPHHGIWIMTANKLLLFNENWERIATVHTSDGLPPTDQRWKIRPYNKDSLLICSKFGASFLHIPHLLERDQEAIPRLTQIDVMNKLRYPLSVLDTLEAIHLPYHENFLSIHLSPIHYHNVHKNKIKWKLEGIDPEWNEKEGAHIATYTSLPPGTYRFLYLAANHQNQWNATPASFSLIIHPPYWQTWWFRGLMACSIGLMVFLLYSYRVRQIKARVQLQHKYEKALSEMEIRALRAQMNPHFLFNSLNSIKHFLISGQIKQGVHYINKFSRLLRLILNHSQLTEVALKDEVRFLELFLQIERIRFNESFSWEIDMDDRIQPEKIAIPPMSIQPFAENAIWHGLMHKDTDRRLLVRIQQVTTEKEERLQIQITDNGIGRAKAQALKSKSIVKDKSMGMELTRQRFLLLGETTTQQEPFTIVDLYENEQPAGTRVIINIPLKKYTYESPAD